MGRGGEGWEWDVNRNLSTEVPVGDTEIECKYSKARSADI